MNAAVTVVSWLPLGSSRSAIDVDTHAEGFNSAIPLGPRLLGPDLPYMIEAHLVVPTMVELGGAGAGVVRHVSRLFEGADVLS